MLVTGGLRAGERVCEKPLSVTVEGMLVRVIEAAPTLHAIEAAPTLHAIDAAPTASGALALSDLQP